MVHTHTRTYMLDILCLGGDGVAAGPMKSSRASDASGSRAMNVEDTSIFAVEVVVSISFVNYGAVINQGLSR